MTGRDPVHRPDADELAAYALGALHEAEAAALRRHLETCAACQEELQAFQQAVDALPLTAPAHAAPRALRRRVMRRAAGERPAPRPERPAGPARPLTEPLGLRRALRAPVLGLAAVAAALAIVAGIVLSSSSPSHPAAVRVFPARVTGQGSAQLHVTGGHGELVVRGFPPPPAGHIYEVWLVRPGRAPAPTSALFSVTATGSGDVGIPGSLSRVSQVLVTPEPDGGTRVPTHSPVISVSLT